MAMSDQFVSERATNSGKDEIPGRVFKDRAVSHVEDVPQVSLVSPRPWSEETHVAKAPRHLGQVLRSYLRVRLPADAVVGQKAVERGVVHRLSADQVNGRLA